MPPTRSKPVRMEKPGSISVKATLRSLWMVWRLKARQEGLPRFWKGLQQVWQDWTLWQSVQVNE